jgi:hypothetical protein
MSCILLILVRQCNWSWDIRKSQFFILDIAQISLTWQPVLKNNIFLVIRWSIKTGLIVTGYFNKVIILYMIKLHAPEYPSNRIFFNLRASYRSIVVVFTSTYSISFYHCHFCSGEFNSHPVMHVVLYTAFRRATVSSVSSTNIVDGVTDLETSVSHNSSFLILHKSP